MSGRVALPPPGGALVCALLPPAAGVRFAHPAGTAATAHLDLAGGVGSDGEGVQAILQAAERSRRRSMAACIQHVVARLQHDCSRCSCSPTHAVAVLLVHLCVWSCFVCMCDLPALVRQSLVAARVIWLRVAVHLAVGASGAGSTVHCQTTSPSTVRRMPAVRIATARKRIAPL